MSDYEKQIEEIIERNKRVEGDKAWETCVTRRGFIALITYIAAYLFMAFNELRDPALQAFIPTGAYILSTLTLPPLKQWWTSKR